MSLQQGMHFRSATLDDVPALLHIESVCFDHDRLSKRSFRRWINAPHGILLVASDDEQRVVGYGLVWCHKGTRLARLYSLAVLPEMRGSGLARQLLEHLERSSAQQDRLYLRLEVAKNNLGAISLYERCGYHVFGEYCDYYEDHTDALRMQKIIQKFDTDLSQRKILWYQQTTDFTCGPAALMMAMSSLDEHRKPTQKVELEIWREATTIFMTSGHGGCHPIGLALAARRRGFEVETYLNSTQTLFVNGVRSAHKKEIMAFVHQQFLDEAEQMDVRIQYQDLSQAKLEGLLKTGWAILILISTYRLDGMKTPHWVAVTGVDERCFYLHDPAPDEPAQLPIDCQYLPILREDFDKMTAFGSERLRAAIAIRQDQVH